MEELRSCGPDAGCPGWDPGTRTSLPTTRSVNEAIWPPSLSCPAENQGTPKQTQRIMRNNNRLLSFGWFVMQQELTNTSYPWRIVSVRTCASQTIGRCGESHDSEMSLRFVLFLFFCPLDEHEVVFTQSLVQETISIILNIWNKPTTTVSFSTVMM